MSILRNPNGAHVTVSDFTTGQDDAGNDLALSDQSIEQWTAGAAITKGMALMLVAPTTTAGPTVIPMTVAVGAANADVWRFAGVALDTYAAGDKARVGCKGIFSVLHDALADPAVYDLLVLPLTSTGEFDLVAGTPIDDTVPVGYYLAGTDAGRTDTALAYVQGGGIAVRFALA